MLQIKQCMWALLIVSTQAWSASAYEVNGFHVGLTFDQALALAEGLGGDCEVEILRRGEMSAGTCVFPVCDEQISESDCETKSRSNVVLEFGDLPLVRIGLKGDVATGTLSKIALAFEGDTDLVANKLVEKYGAPFSDTTDHKEKSWSHSRRMHWKSGREGIGLLRYINTITLSLDPPLNPAPESQ